MINLKTRILDYWERHEGWMIHRQESVTLLGKTYRVVRGTIRKQVDYDDAWLLALAQEAHIVFDIGCNIGQSAILLLHSGYIDQIVLIDPNPTALSQAAENLILNGLSGKARFVSAFAADQPDEVKEFYTVGAGAAGSMYASNAGTASALGISFMVSTVTVDDLVERYHLVPDLVKIDVEGAEHSVLEGATTLARRQQTLFFVEMHSSNELPMEENAMHVLNWCQQVGYEAWYMKDKTRLTTSEPIKGRGRCHLLLLPCEAKFPESLVDLEQGAPLSKVQVTKSFNSLVPSQTGTF